MSKYENLLKRYDLLGEVCEQLRSKLIHTENELKRIGAALVSANDTIVKGQKLVDQLMNVTLVNERLQQENERLTAIVEGLEPLSHGDVEA